MQVLCTSKWKAYTTTTIQLQAQCVQKSKYLNRTFQEQSAISKDNQKVSDVTLEHFLLLFRILLGSRKVEFQEK